ncbi:MAG: hypothetical protein CMI02_09415 [Oceanospirillaceae bacterium]|nr:hypothetical protein [Oceanospirillaceae bacterium]MBT12241.1 hypothetical protein [Oceanospirillaceae bacterium]|tara:strand:- start:18872 stop:19174 length:303 start_codon:yes stop_codon:yes gene_type:complete
MLIHDTGSQYVMKTIISISALAGLIITVIYSLSTAAVSGHHVETGEAINLSGWQAIYVFIAEKGLHAYIFSLLPVFLSFTAIIAFTWRYILHRKQKNSDA